MSSPSDPRQHSLATAQRFDRRVAKLGRTIVTVTERLRRARNARLATGLVFFAGLFLLTIRPELRLELVALVVFTVVFGALVVRTRRIELFQTRLYRLLEFDHRQRRRCLGEAVLENGANLDPAIAKLLQESGEAYRNRDLQLFGSHSLWAMIDETFTDRGARLLAHWMNRDPLPAAEIRARQKRVETLDSEAWFLTRLRLEASGAELRMSSSQIMGFIAAPLVEKGFSIAYALNFAAWAAAAALLFWSPGWAFALFASVSWLTIGKWGSPYGKGVGLAYHLDALHPIFGRLEARLKDSRNPTLLEMCATVAMQGPARQSRRLARALDILSVQSNPLVFLIVNSFLPWTVTGSFLLERIRKKLATSFGACLDELAELEAHASLVLLRQHQTRNFPRILDETEKPTLRVSALFHPLLARPRAVANDFSFPERKTLGLLTGSNMSGKSTFLRTLGVNQTLANMGAPVYAGEYTCTPLALESCIEVSDSLRDGFSYFYAEVRRLKVLLDRAASGQPVLFLIDEIFRGTNNRERQIGSRAVIRALAGTPKALGFVSTHDLELTRLEEELPSLFNLHFREDIDAAGVMRFTYHLRPGPCPTTNALTIMRSEGLPLD